MEKKIKILVAHSGQQHSYRLASALKKYNMLCKYVTTVYDKQSSFLMGIAKKVLSDENKKRADGRRNKDLLDTDVVQFCEMSGFIEIFLARYDKSTKIYRWWSRITSNRFGRKVARLAVKYNADAVILYDTNAKTGFTCLKNKAPHILRIMDVSAANRLYMKEIYERDFEIASEFTGELKKEIGFLWKVKEEKRLKEETDLTQYFLVASEFVKRSLEYSGVRSSQIEICAYGSYFKPDKLRKKKQRKHLQALFVGNVTEMKGIYYLLEAIMQIPYQDIHLTVIGNYDKSNEIFERYKERVLFTGRVLHEQVMDYMIEADFLVFPSLGDGFGLSVLEALSCGLPCIVTENTGAADIIKDYENGFVVPIQNIDALKNRMVWFYNNKVKIPEMSLHSIETAKKYTWENYEKNVTKAIKHFLNFEGENENRYK